MSGILEPQVANYSSAEDWKPFDKQLDFLNLPDDIFEAMYGGAAGGGKSEILIWTPVLRGFHKFPRFQGIIFRKTYPQLNKSIIPRARQVYKLFGATYNSTTHTFTFPTGAQIFLSYLETRKHVEEHDTAEYQYVAFDELTHFEEEVYLYMTHRCRSSIPGLKAIVRSGTNPGNIGHVWVRGRFVLPNLNGGEVLYDDRSKTYRIFIKSKLDDNPHLDKIDPTYRHRLNLLPEADRRAKLEGDWFIFEGQVFSEFRPVKRTNEPENAIHVVEPFEIPDYWPKFLAIDWGFTAHTWAGWAAISPDNRAFLYREYHERKKFITNWSSDITRLSQRDENLIVVSMDPSAWQERGERTIAGKFSDQFGSWPKKSINARVAGKSLIHEYLRWKPRPKKYIPPGGFSHETAQRIFRLRGFEAYKNYQSAFIPEAEESGIPKLQIFNTCKAVIDVLPSCQYDEKRKEDVAEFEGDDPYDGLRYLLQEVDLYINDPNHEYIEIKRQTEILKRFEETKNFTTLFMEMERLKGRDDRISINRFN